ncbi:DUF86 domain-containing protein [Mariniphaga sp.]|uniref:HepT-like ribonuclease domain-containing protein n=1 Tax=Mariniphaga sp. TaxID=1954475 RepID=UPI003568E1BF
MDEKILKWLYDIRNALNEIDGYFTNLPLDFTYYKNNTILKRAVERDLEIIGEAVKRILNNDPNFPIENARRIVGLRNQIIHAYDNISDENIWAIIIKHLPLLKNEVENMIENN